MFYFKKYFIISITALLLSTVLFIGCHHKKPDPEEVVVAKIGDEIITARDFRRNYEFGFAHLKREPDRKRSYLDYMIKEKVLSLEGYKLCLDKSPRVKKLENQLLKELLVEELFNQDVKSKIKVTPHEVKEAITKSKVSWKLRYWMEPYPDYAERVCQAMRQRGYSAVVDEILKSNPEVHLKPKDFETNYLTYLDVSDELLDAIKNLPIGAISDPIEMNGVYYIFQVTDIRREPIRDYDYKNKYESFRQILFYRKLKKAAGKYVSSFMTPKNVVTKGEAFRTLASALEEWLKEHPDEPDSFMVAVSQAEDSNSSLAKLKANLNETLVTFKGGSWSIKDFLQQFDPGTVKLKNDDRTRFRSKLNQQIALTVRDYFFVKEAKKRGLEKSPNVQRQLKEWRDKWVYEEARHVFTKSLHITDKEAKEYFEKYKDRYKIRWTDNPKFEEFKTAAKRNAYIQRAKSLLSQKVDSLYTTFPVVINQAVLDTITTIEFQKSRWATLQVFKGSSNRLAVPIVDPAWGF